MNPHIPIWVAMLRLACALFCGLLIGAEREWRQRLAGVRTFCLVSVGAALFVMLAPLIGQVGEMSRISAQVASGIGFLGAGVLIRTGIGVRGLNTASSIWCCAALGTLAGAGCYFTALGGTIVVLIIIVALRPLTHWIHQHSSVVAAEAARYRLSILCKHRDETRVRILLVELIHDSPLGLHELSSTADDEHKQTTITAQISAPERLDPQLEELAGRLAADPDIKTVTWTATPGDSPEGI